MSGSDAAPKAGGGGVGPRHAARIAAVQALYQCEVGGEPAALIVEEFAAHRLDQELDGVTIGRTDREWFTDLVRGAAARMSEIDKLLAGCLDKDRDLARLEAIMRSCLRAAAFELLARPDVPAKVVINEYVEVARTFFTGNEPAFANGVLDRLAHQLRPGELQGTGHGKARKAD